MAYISVPLNTTLDFVSQDFLPLGIEYQLYRPDKSMKFMSVSGQLITFAPMVRDIGTHTIYLVGKDDKGMKYYQEVRVRVPSY